MKTNALGVVVVRLQVPELHSGHRYLLNTVTMIHKNVLVIIGETEARLTQKDPLTFEMRKAMLLSVYPTVRVAPLADQPDDHAWSESLDSLITRSDDPGEEADPILYGGRDSFLKHYHGIYRTFELPPIEPISGTELREAVLPRDTVDFRLGMIYASKHKFPISYQCVDAAIMGTGGRILVGQKKRDNGKWRFIGGFVSAQDTSLEAAVTREVREETGIEPGDPEYIGSVQIDDFRYPIGGTDQLMSAFFLVPCTFGAGVASDDLDATQWMSFHDLRDNLVHEHLDLLGMLEEHLHKTVGALPDVC